MFFGLAFPFKVILDIFDAQVIFGVLDISEILVLE